MASFYFLNDCHRSGVGSIVGWHILNPADIPMEAVMVTADNSGDEDLTDPNGYYQLTVINYANIQADQVDDGRRIRVLTIEAQAASISHKE